MSKHKHKDMQCSCLVKLLHKKQNTKPTALNINKNKKNKKEKNRKNKDSSSPIRVRFLDTTMTKSDKTNVKSLQNSKHNRFSSGTKSDRLIKSSNYCRPCRTKITKEEFHKAAGDQLFNQKILNKIRSPCCSAEKIMSKIRDKMRCAMNAEKPLFEMQVDAGTYEILNRNEVIHNVPKLKTKCKPVIEVKMDPNMRKILNKRAVIDDIIKSNTKSKENRIRSIMKIMISQEKICPWRRGRMTDKDPKIRKLTGKPCICGSSVCAKKVKNMKTPITRHKWKTCVCGSPVCDSESAKIKALSAYVENKCLCEKEMAKLKAKKLEKEKEERAIRLKLYEKSDKIRRKKRKKEEKRMEKKIDKKAPDGVLFAESVLDVGKLGITATANLLCNIARCARDPKHAIQTLRILEENPKLVPKFLKSTYHDTGLTATLRRIRLRCLAMKGLTKIRRKLGSYPVANYLVHIASNDPKRRLLKKKKMRPKPKRERERFDFNCSLYMGSLRKKPFLSVYERCPWFYQHFLSLVYAWKQFLDICLFLLAAIVWSPCILCMEICRACMCCFFCTG
ncbi:uncharacterized protein [Maniola hyperantus]|uniref:uncharacterized protein n=1 Tax=Aphantopus hyperantus TaxID=2795564 RepID=UPI0037499B5E